MLKLSGITFTLLNDNALFSKIMHKKMPQLHLYCRKPLVSLFPTLFKHNLLSFIHLLFPRVPQAAVLQLLQCLRQESIQSPWVSVMSRQLERNFGCHTKGLYTSECNQRLRSLTQSLVGQAETSEWAQCTSGHPVDQALQQESVFTSQATQKKRKISVVTQDSDGEESRQQSKRVKADISDEDAAAVGCGAQEAASEEVSPADSTRETQETKPDNLCNDLPDQMKVRVLLVHKNPTMNNQFTLN